MSRVMVWVVVGVLFAATALAQAGATITGRVVSGATRTPVSGVVVRAGGASAETDRDGRFTLPVTAAAEGSMHVTTAAVGYLDQEVDVTLVSGRAEIEILLARNPAYHEEVEVTGRTEEVAAAPPTLVLDPIEVTRVAGANDNIYRVLQTLPGVTATDDFGSRLAVRGGGPDQNLTVMDGVEIHNPYRLFGLTSAFNPETIDRFELTAGGFSAKYGDRLSSILLVDNRAGTTERTVAVSGALSLTDANVVGEGALPHGSWLVTGRRTYYDIIAERITDDDLPSFEDVQAKAVWNLGTGRQLTIFGLRSRESTDASFDGDVSGDRIGFKDTSKNDVASITFSTLIGKRTTLKTIGAWYRYRDVLGVDGTIRSDSTRSNGPVDADSFGRAQIVFDRSLSVRDLSIREEAAVAISSRQTLNAGFEGHALTTAWGWTITGDRNPSAANGSSVQGGAGLPSLLDSSADSPRTGAWVEDDVMITPRVHLAGGLRFDWSRLADEVVVGPRARATVDLTPRLKLRLAAGLFSQSPGYEKLLQSDYFVDLTNTVSLGLKSERSIHVIGGLERELSDLISARVETYYKTFDRAIAGRLETPEETAARVAQYAFPAELVSSVPSAPQITSTPTNDATGRSYGVDFYLEKRARGSEDRLSGWIAYTWGRATLDNYGLTFPFDYDRRHSLSVVSTWRVRPKFALSSTLRVASGFPYTAPVGLRVASVLAPGAIEGSPDSLVPKRDANGLYTWTVDYGGVENLNRGRLPVYARLDLRFAYIHSPTTRWQLYFEAINALRHENASQLTPSLEYDPTSDRPLLTTSRDGGLPFFPSVGFRIRF